MGAGKNGNGGPAFATAAFAVASAANASTSGQAGAGVGDLEAQEAVVQVASAVWAYLEVELDLLGASPHVDAR